MIIKGNIAYKAKSRKTTLQEEINKIPISEPSELSLLPT
jgi:hypothetical protein